MSLASPLQSSLSVEESLTNGVIQDPGIGIGGTVALGVSGDNPCGEKAKMGEEVVAEEVKEVTSICSDAATSTITTTTSGHSIPSQVNTMKWSSEEYLQNISISKDDVDQVEDLVSS